LYIALSNQNAKRRSVLWKKIRFPADKSIFLNGNAHELLKIESDVPHTWLLINELGNKWDIAKLHIEVNLYVLIRK